MKNAPMKIEQLGFDKWFLDRIDPSKLIDHRIARVVAVNKDSYTIYEMSYLEKKRKDKKFGKFVKSVMKAKKYRR
jgi:hypothetical protein